MAQWYLYKCEVCGVAVFSNQDHGMAWYNDCCGICKTWTYYDRVIITKCPAGLPLPLFDEVYLFLSNRGENEKDGTEESSK